MYKYATTFFKDRRDKIITERSSEMILVIT